ncbi:uncharacterized protein YukE [Actinoplanes octamycinicus]|uniref:Uncharacterized protein YukE n=1 Tax=Actinoplanes octamycinicus TaxID=135948 RepID=A0A7W7MBQ6_9ACTN|nr:hypothetical protein [Actinoplanes octamycinicus]MBB4744364.1 uncharacterized protein YukE [Actinoplanes octamycinicus]GIE56674.1 hypothetical protein Aoc01nite_20760 [Actinoplanes octamycinicus]
MDDDNDQALTVPGWEDPTDHLAVPGDPDESISNGFVNPLDLFNAVSPSAWLNEAIEGITGVDVFGWFTEWLAGDWEGIWKFGDAMANLARCVQQVGIDIQAGMNQLDQSWNGNAGDAAYAYFSDLAARTSGQQTAIAPGGDAYHKAATGAWQVSNQLGNILQALADSAVLWCLTVGASGALYGTGVGAVVGTAGVGAAALITLQMLSLINKASTIINTAGTVILGLIGEGMSLAYQGGDLSSRPLPHAPYVSPAV